MDLLIALSALAFLMFVAYRGYSVILFTPIAALASKTLPPDSIGPNEEMKPWWKLLRDRC
jgi:hypothetical protein